jgi:hypothetical protein
MARLLAFGGDNGHRALSELDSVDLQAIRLVHAFGWDSDPPSPFREGLDLHTVSA